MKKDKKNSIITLKTMPPKEEWMSIPEFRDYLKEKYKTTPKCGKEIGIHYTHYIVERRHLPFAWGGNKLELGKCRSLLLVRISNEIAVKGTSTGRPKGVTQRTTITKKVFIN